jgi:hypothetical protein
MPAIQMPAPSALLASDLFRWFLMTARLVLSASLALACGGRESNSIPRKPSEPASTVASASPEASPAPESSPEPAEAAGIHAPPARWPPQAALPTAARRTLRTTFISGSREACSARELPECDAGTQPFVDDCGCSSAPLFSRECRYDCRLRGSCPARRFEDFPDLELTLSAWQDDAQNSGQFSFGSWLVEGSCADGHRFLYRSNHYFWQASLFTAAGLFLSTGSHGDESGGTCSGSYFPEPTQCGGGTVTRGWVKDESTPFQVGDPVTLP